MSTLSMWAIERDRRWLSRRNRRQQLSGIVQNTWDFSRLLEPFTG